MTTLIDPPTFQQVGLAWVGAVTVVATAALGAVIMLWPKVQAIRDAMGTHQQALVSTNESVRAINPDAPSVVPVVGDGNAVAVSRGTEDHD